MRTLRQRLLVVTSVLGLAFSANAQQFPSCPLTFNGPDVIVGVGGCWAQSVKDEVFERFPGGIGEFDVNKPEARFAQLFTQPGRARLVQVIKQRRLADAPLAYDRAALQRA